MAPRKRASKQANDDSDASTEREDRAEAQRKAKSKGKRRLSEIQRPDNITVPPNDGSDSDEDHMPGPSKIARRHSNIDLNDDAAEKRRRRKSAKQSVAFITPLNAGEKEAAQRARDDDEDGTPRRGVAAPGPRTPKASALARANHLSLVNQTPNLQVPVDIQNGKYEEWMKLATDNKINVNNAWNFALIDYFQDMSILRNELDNSINFQKASFTLDGCVKIWTSRVDSVGTETGKLLSNLADELRGVQAGGDGEDGEDEDGEPKAKKNKAHRAEATLAKSLAQLQVKKLDLEFTVDPLFKKTSADFDEGGAMGLLMNHLGVDEYIRVVFDAGDSKLEGLDDETPDADSVPVDLGEIRANILPSIDDVIMNKTISESLADFRFSGSAMPDFANMHSFNRDFDNHDDDGHSDAGGGGGMDDYDGGGMGGGGGDFGDGAGGDMGDNQDGGPAEDFFTGDQAVQEDFVYGTNAAGNTGGVPGPGGLGPVENFDPRRGPGGRDLVMQMTEDGENMLDYFDAAAMKNWAGPQHWKLRRAVKKADPEAGHPITTKKEKVAFEINFLAPSVQTSKELFVPATGTTIVLPAGTGATTTSSSKRKSKKALTKRDNHLLPDDMHFSSAQLLRLFRKPKFTLRMRRHRDMANGELGDGEIDERFWAKAAAAQAQGGHTNGDGDEDLTGNPIPFNTQFFHDDYDEGGGFEEEFVDGDLAVGLGDRVDEEDLIAATQGQLKRTRPEFVNYAKRAKRVDVRKLKENIWKSLDIVVDHQDDDNRDNEDVVEKGVPTDPKESRQFNTVIDRLSTSYPREKMDEISTSFCFICLLHLANEQGLKLEVDPTKRTVKEDPSAIVVEDEDAEAQARIGELWGLKVFRDPNATRSA
ncbi:hypothetical protein FRB94_012733 [Tulasnella sp. JGI-2019a]|nr:hypothetical protein FRB94_012733 [Tulasnella sp. JGI-2019a]KAG9018445.1 hypothetical protein FRB93_000148 [Tulasnella sp. JGI-2019a]KAG9031827.1 hypothetical protein FRB95_002272 [Tulasnella sp. JGI-2019a]